MLTSAWRSPAALSPFQPASTDHRYSAVNCWRSLGHGGADVESSGAVTARERRPDAVPVSRSMQYRQFAAPQALARVEGGAVAVGVARVALLAAQARRQNRCRRERKVRLPVQRRARRTVTAVEQAHESVGQVAAVVGNVVVLLEALQPDARDPGMARRRLAREAQVFARGAAHAAGAREIVVRPRFAPLGFVAPVAVEARDDVRLGDSRDRAPRAPAAGVKRQVERCTVGTLRVAPGTVRQRDEAVVDREGVVAVVEVGMQQREVRAPGALGGEPELQPRGRLVAAVGVVAPEEAVVAESVADRALQHGAPGAGEVLARGEPAARGRAGRPEAIAADRELRAEFPDRLRVARLHLDQPAERIRPVARALRAAQHLHLLHVECRGDHADAAEVDLVHQETDGRIRRALVLLELADAPQLEVARARTRAGPGQRGNLRQQLLEMDHGCLAHVPGSEHGHPARPLGHRHRPQRGRHENGLELHRRLRRRCGGAHQEARDKWQRFQRHACSLRRS